MCIFGWKERIHFVKVVAVEAESAELIAAETANSPLDRN
jgi:hypothetical protein